MTISEVLEYARVEFGEWDCLDEEERTEVAEQFVDRLREMQAAAIRFAADGTRGEDYDRLADLASRVARGDVEVT